jgi:hypothetical protein
MVSLEIVENRLVEIRNKKVLLDRDVAALYGIETKRVNEAVKNNPDKFPDGYVIYLDHEETEFLRSKTSKVDNENQPVENFDRFKTMKHSTVKPKAFTDKGLYMLATILKSSQATETTLAIIETYAKLKQFMNAIQEIRVNDSETKKEAILMKGSELFSEILLDELKLDETETTIELNLALLKLKHTVKRKIKE